MRRLDDHYFRLSEAQKSGYLDVGNGHNLYWEESGNPDGIALLIIHGGPGGGNSMNYRIFTDPKIFRIIQFDQRGCGRSEPRGLLEDNTLQHTLVDIEALRLFLAVDKWIVAGGSWGSTVALAYGEAHSNHCLGLLLVSMWLTRKKDKDWWYQGVRRIFPELWEQFAAPIPKIERDDLCKAYSDRILLNDDKEMSKKWAINLYLYEEGFMHFDAPLTPPNLDNAENYGRIFSHFASNNFFLKEEQLLNNAYHVKSLPIVIVTGRYDMCTTPDNAYDLAEKLDNAELIIVPAAGHYSSEISMSRACLEALAHLMTKIDKKNNEI